jgi:hypothetical protein
MSRNATWNLAKLRQHAGDLVLLTGIDVAISYELDTQTSARVTFFLREDGRFAPCVCERGPVRTLVELLNVYAGTVKPTQRLGDAVAGPHGPPSRDARRIDPARRGVHRGVLLSPPPGGAGCGCTAPGSFLANGNATSRGRVGQTPRGSLSERRCDDDNRYPGVAGGWTAAESHARVPRGRSP